MPTDVVATDEFAEWYDDLIEQSPDSFQAKVILPNLLRILDLATKTRSLAELAKALPKRLLLWNFPRTLRRSWTKFWMLNSMRLGLPAKATKLSKAIILRSAEQPLL